MNDHFKICNDCIMKNSGAMCCEFYKISVAAYELKKEIPVIKNFSKLEKCVYYVKGEK